MTDGNSEPTLKDLMQTLVSIKSAVDGINNRLCSVEERIGKVEEKLCKVGELEFKIVSVEEVKNTSLTAMIHRKKILQKLKAPTQECKRRMKYFGTKSTF